MAEPPFPLVDVAGPPFERGRAYGAAARDRVHASIALYSKALAARGLTAPDVAALARAILPAIEAFEASFVAEMRGIADGAGTSLEDIVLVNARTEMLQAAERRAAPGDHDGCTGLVVLGDATADGSVIHAQNWDWRAACAATSVVLRIRRDDGPDVLTFTEAGGLARSGLNALGHSITANYLESDRDGRSTGIPLPFIRRKALEAQHFADMIGIVATTPKSVSNNMMLAHRDGFAIDLECAPDECFSLYPRDGLLVHANHWQSPVALTKLEERGLVDSPDSLYRDVRVRDILERAHGAVTMQVVETALADRFGAPFAVCRPPCRSRGAEDFATVATIILAPAAGEMRICPSPWRNDTFTTYRLTG